MALSEAMRQKIQQTVENKTGGSSPSQQTSSQPTTSQTPTSQSSTLSNAVKDRIRKSVTMKRIGREDTGVDGDYISKFVNDSKLFSYKSKYDYDRLNYQNSRDSSASTQRADTARDLSDRAAAIQTFMDLNREEIDDETYESLSAYLSDFQRYSHELMGAFEDASEYYSQWDTEEEYNKYVAYKEDYDAKSKLDIPTAEKEIADLEAKREDYAQNHVFDWTNYQEREAHKVALADMDQQINSKKQFMNQAKHIQEGITLSGVADPESKHYDPKFESQTGYVSTKDDGIWSKLTSQFGMGYDDLAYEYINNQNGIRDEIKQKQRSYSSDSPFSDGESTFEEKGYDLLTENEIAIYNYYYSKSGKEAATRYLNSIQETLNQRKATGMYADLEGNTAMELVFGVEAGLDQFQSGLKGLARAIVSDDSYAPASATQMTSGMVREDLADAGFKLPEFLGGASVGQAAYDAVTTTSNMAPSILASIGMNILAPGSGQIVGSALMGGSASGNAYQEKINAGWDKEQAQSYATLVGGSEAALSYLLGGIGKLGGILPEGVMTPLLNNVDNAFARVALQLGGNMLSEGFEEGLQEILTPWFESIITGAEYEVSSADVLYSSLLGSLTAFFMEGGSTVTGEVNTYRTGRQLQKADISAQRLAELGSTFAADTVAHQLAGRVNENTGAYTMGRLFNEIGATLTEQNTADITRSLTGKGMNAEIAAKHAEIMEYIVEGGTLSDVQMKLIEKNDVLADTMREVIIDKNSTVNQRMQGYNAALMALAKDTASGKTADASTAEQSGTSQEIPSSEGIETPTAEKAAEGHYEASTDGKTILVESNEPVTIKEVASIKDGQMTLRLDDGREVNANDVSYSSESEALIYETVASLGTNPSAANLLINAYHTDTGMNASAYALGIKEAYRYGQYNYPTAEVASAPFASMLTEHQRNTAYRLGQMFGGKQVAKAQATVRSNRTVGKDTNVPGKTTGKVHFDGNRNSLTERQSASLSALETVADALGIQIHVFRSKLGKDGKRIGANGWYDPTDGSIHIDLHAGANGEGTMLFTASHELVHFIKQWSPAEFKVLANFLMQEYGKKGVKVESLVLEQIAKAKRNGRTISYDTAYEEVIADSMEMMLSDGNIVEKLAKLKTRDKRLWQKIKDFISDLAAKIRSAYEGMSPDSKEGRYVAEMKDAIEHLQELFTEGLMDASQNYQNTIGSRNMDDFEAAKTPDGESLFQYRAMEADEDTYRQMLKTWGKMSDVQITNLFTTIDKAMEIIKDNLDALDFAWEADINDRAFSPVKPNSDSLYQVSLDFSTLCRKRILQQTVQAQLQEALNKPLTRDEGIAIRDALMEIQKEGRQIEVACALCYVESARMKSPEQIQRFMNNKEKVIKDFFASKSGGDMKAKVKKAEADARERLGVGDKPLKQLPGKVAAEIRAAKKEAKASYVPTEEEQKVIEIAKGMTVSDFTSPEGLENLAKNHRDLFDAYTSYIRNATKSKGIENDTWWRAGDSMKIGDVLIANMNKENGLRSQSWSDFQVIHILDYIAATIELSTRNTKEQAYSKVPDYVELMGQTGVMINMSLIPTAQFDGSLRYDSVEGIDYNRSLELRDKYPATAGTICIGVDNKQIQLLLADNTIDYVIPYHRSGMSAHIRKAMHIPTWGEYQDYQSESKLSRAEAQKRAEQYGVKLLDESDPNYQKHTSFSEWFDLKEAQQIAQMENAYPSDQAKQKKYGKMYGGYMAMQNAGNNYLKLCAERGLAPKFSHEKADFTGEDNYWKLLIDRKMVNNATGEIIEQQTIKPIFDQGEVLRILNDELDRYPKVKADQEYAIRKVTEAYLSGDLKAGMSADAIAKVMQKPVDNVTKTNILSSSEIKFHGRDYVPDITEDDLYPETGRERSVFNRGYINKTSGLKPGDRRNIIINTGAYVYFIRAYGATGHNPYTGEIFKKVPVDEYVESDILEEYKNGAYEPTEEDNLSSEAPRSYRRRGSNRYKSLKERLAAEGYDHLLADESGSDSDGYRGQGSGTGQSGGIKRSDRDNAPTFYSNMARVVDGVKQEKLGAASVVNMLRGKGVKAEEIKWSGIETFLEGKKSVTKAELQEFIAGSMLQIEEETLTNEEMPYSQEHLDLIAKYEAERDIIAENLKSEWKRIVGTDIPIVYFGAGLESAVVNNLLEANATKKGNTEAGYKYKAARAALQRCIEYSDDYFGYDNEKQAFREALRNPNGFMSAYEMSSFEKGVFRDFIKAKEAYSKVEGIPVQDQKVLKDIAASADRFSNRISNVKSEHYTEAAKHTTKYGSYTIRGGSNYRELLFRMPGSTYSNNPMGIHWDRSGVLAHARIQDLNTFLGKMLFIEEIQSDWHNEGHKSGYRNGPDLATVENTSVKLVDGRYVLYHKGKSLEQSVSERLVSRKGLSEERIHEGLVKDFNHNAEYDARVPDAPFRDNYHEYVLKRLIRMAAEQGYDSIGWTTADIQSKRWSDEFAEGYRIEYDQDIPKFLNKYGKKWGTKVGKTVLDNGTEVWSMAITDSMMESVLTEGQPLYSDRDTESVSNRSLLANAFEGIAQNDIEKRKIQEYKEKITLIEAEEQNLQALNEQIRKLAFSDSKEDRDKAKELRFEANQAANRINTYDRQLLRLEASKPLQDVLQREKKMAYDRAAEKTRAAIESYRKRSEAQQQKIVEKYQESRKRGIENRHKTAMRQKIRKVIRDLDSILNRGDKKRNVKEGMKDFVAEALMSAEVLFTDSYSNESMVMNGVGTELTAAETKLMEEAKAILEELSNLPTGYEGWEARQETEAKLKGKLGYRMSKLSDVFVRERARLNKTQVSEVLGNLADAYKALEGSEQNYLRDAFHDNVYQYLLMLKDEVGGTIVKDMSLEQLESLYKAYTMVKTTVYNANRMFADNIKESRDILANRVMREVRTAGGEHGLWTKGQEDLNAFSWNNLKPVYAFERLGSETMKTLYGNIRKGQDTWAVDMQEADAFRKEISKKYKRSEWDFEKQHKFKSSFDEEFELSLEQIMSLYAYSKREQAHEHLLKGGFVFDKNTEVVVTKKGFKRTYLNKSATAYNLSMNVFEQIVSTLTEDQRAFVDEMQDYLSSTMGEKGNDVSMEIYGVKLFNEKFYFPLRSAGQYMERAKEATMKKEQGQINIVNSGFAKATVQRASNPVVLSGFMDVWAEHVNEMSMYHSFVLPMEDFRRVYNYSSPHMEEQPSVSVNQVIENAYGSAATAYIDQLYRDLNGGAVTDPRENLARRLTGKFKKAAVFASASVVIQQPSAIGRAFALIDPKHFIGPKVDSKRHKALWEEAKKYAPVAFIKEMGYFDTGMGRSAVDFLQSEEYSGIKEKAKAFVKDESFRDEQLGKAPALADEITWCAIWEAVKRETRAKNPQMDVKSEEFLQKAGDRFSEVIDKTQVYDSVLARSANMRAKGIFMNIWTSFMAEPTTSINMVEDALRKAKKGDKKGASRAIGAVYASVLINSALVSLVYAMRDDDEDETFLEKYASSFMTEVMDGTNPLTYYPFLKDIWSVMQGYDIERSDMSLITDLVDTLQKTVQVISKDDPDGQEIAAAMWSVVDSISSLIGLPVKNIRRDINGAVNMIKTIGTDLTERDTSWGSLMDSVWSSMKNSIPIVGWLPDETKRDKLYRAVLRGDTAYVDRLKSSYKDEDAFHNAMKAAVKERYLDGKIGKREASNQIINYAGVSIPDAYWELKAWTYEKDNGTSDGYSKYGWFFETVESGEDIEEAVKNYTANGVKEKTLRSELTSHFKPLYMEMSEAERAAFRPKLEKALLATGADTWDLEDTIAEWDFEAKYGSSYNDMIASFKEGTISREKMRGALLDRGFDEEETEEKLEGWAFEAEYGFSYSEREDAYKAGLISASEMRQVLIDIGGKTEEEADELIEAFEWLKAHPEKDVYASKVVYWKRDLEDLGYSVEDSGIDIDTYLREYDVIEDFESDKDANGNSIAYSKINKAFPYINGLNLTPEQKTALAVACGWSLKTVNKKKLW